MNSQTYVSDPTIWEQFYKNMSNNKFNPYRYRKHRTNQIGRGLYGRIRGSYMIPVNSNTSTDDSISNAPLITPVAASAERAESQLKEELKKRKPHVKLLKGIKRVKTKKRIKKIKSSKRKTSKNRSGKSRKPTAKIRKRKRNKEYDDSVWNQQIVKKRKS